MWIVLTALRRPYTFVVLAVLIVLFGVGAAMQTPTDIFPNIKIPVVSVVWTYNGLPPDEMSGRVIYYYERTLTARSATSSTSNRSRCRAMASSRYFFSRMWTSPPRWRK